MPVGQVVSLGDVFTYAGVMWFVIASMRPARRPEEAAGSGEEPIAGGGRGARTSGDPRDRPLDTEQSA